MDHGTLPHNQYCMSQPLGYLRCPRPVEMSTMKHHSYTRPGDGVTSLQDVNLGAATRINSFGVRRYHKSALMCGMVMHRTV